ncbi:MAG: MoxR family ATPase [Xanthomonadales bacterium]|jgi:MoxR-like ATPase|nr:MoxR family ATPase [Xanthomonadales bacterium]
MSADSAAPQNLLTRIEAQLSGIIVGKPRELRLALTCLLARGHLLLEDLPGVGKTTLAHALAKVFALDFQRVQFTVDLLPTDLTGVAVWRREAERFEFQPGPLFTQVLLADELNRGSPKTQSALLEAMAEGQVTADGQTRGLPKPFFVIATQNPAEQIGTFALPESQLDRFLVSLSLGYPDPAAERELLLGRERRDLLAELKPVCSVEQLLALQAAVRAVTVSDTLVDYLQRLLTATRDDSRLRYGLSPRAGLGLIQLARAHALLAGRRYVMPEDLQSVFVAASQHRLHPKAGGIVRGTQVAREILLKVPTVPGA